MKLIALALSLIILTQTAFAGETPVEGNQSQIKNRSDGQAWWTNRAGGLVGGIIGSVVGLTGAAIGTLGGIGIARKLCLFLLGAMFVFGVASLVTGLVALAFSQPYAVYYPLLLMGVPCIILPAVLFGTIKRRYEQKELQKMHAMDIR
jgi:hypothetical protein